MSETAHQLDHEFWRPPVHTAISEPEPRLQVETCPRCSTEFIVGSRFCYVCGSEREPQPEVAESRLARLLDFQLIRENLGLTVPSLIAFIIGLVCVGAAVATGFMYTASTVLDWQAVQIWRVEWLLASAVAFIAGILLKRTGV
jgi:hypothetical protein